MLKLPMRLYCDDSSAIYIARNPVFYERTKLKWTVMLYTKSYDANIIEPKHGSSAKTMPYGRSQIYVTQ